MQAAKNIIMNQSIQYMNTIQTQATTIHCRSAVQTNHETKKDEDVAGQACA